MDDKWLEQLKQGKCISERELKILCEKVIILFTIGKRDSCRRVKCPTGKCTRNSMRRHPWPVLRLDGAIQNWW